MEARKLQTTWKPNKLGNPQKRKPLQKPTKTKGMEISRNRWKQRQPRRLKKQQTMTLRQQRTPCKSRNHTQTKATYKTAHPILPICCQLFIHEYWMHANHTIVQRAGFVILYSNNISWMHVCTWCSDTEYTTSLDISCSSCRIKLERPKTHALSRELHAAGFMLTAAPTETAGRASSNLKQYTGFKNERHKPCHESVLSHVTGSQFGQVFFSPQFCGL